MTDEKGKGDCGRVGRIPADGAEPPQGLLDKVGIEYISERQPGSLGKRVEKSFDLRGSGATVTTGHDWPPCLSLL